MTEKLTTITAIFIALTGLARAADIFVSPNGADVNPGTKSQPLASLSAARDKVRKVAGKEPVTVHMADGIYYLPETLILTPADSGTEKNPVIYQAVNDGNAVMSGGAKLDLTLAPYKDGVFQAKTPAGLEIDQLFINGKNQRMARYPNYDASKKTDAYQGFAADAFSKERAARWADPAGGYMHVMHSSQWGGYQYRITGKDAAGELTYEGGWQNNRKGPMHKEFRMVENIFEELDAPGEWFHNTKTGTLYYMPAPDTDLPKATVEVVRLRHLIEFQGTSGAPVKNITFDGFVVRHAARTFMDTKEPLLRSDWTIYRGGSFLLNGTEDVSILDCEFDQVGGNAVFVSNYNRRTLVKGCHIHDAGASGVCFVGDPAAVRDPLFEYGKKNDLSNIDRTPGPKTDNYPAQGTVEDCLIHGIGRLERQPAGVMMDMAMAITVRDTSVYDCARSGINIGDGAWGGHLIERCDVFDTVLETHDHGSFNSWGRDRYWRADHMESSQPAVDADPKLPFLDAMKTTVIRDSRWRCDHGWDIDLDDGSSNYDIYNNVMLKGGLKFREGFRRHAWNNVIIGKTLSAHVWFNSSKDSVTSNIMASPSEPYFPVQISPGGLVNHNFYYGVGENRLTGVREKFGWDKESMVGDPLFVDAANGDFRVKDRSPALEIGFKNFPMDQFGVKKASLKSIAQTPEIPETSVARQDGGQGAVVLAPVESYWLGAKLHELEGEEFSAYGVTKVDGGIALVEVPEGSEASRLGLKANDLIQALNEYKVSNLRQFFGAITNIGATPLKVAAVRNQKNGVIPVSGNSYVTVELSDTADGFSKLGLPAVPAHLVSTNQATSDEPVATLTDGKLAENYGAIFANGIQNGTYRIDLGGAKSVAAITSWSFKMGQRGVQKVTLYGSKSETDPGWNLEDRSRFLPLGSIDTSSANAKAFTAASLHAPLGRSLGTFRWIIWRVSPVNTVGGGENTAFQELGVEAR